MVHLRLNENEPNPNPHVNFISALPMADTCEHELARQLLRALAAQVRPVMKAHGFVVNSLEEVRCDGYKPGFEMERTWLNVRDSTSITLSSLVETGTTGRLSVNLFISRKLS